MLHCLWFSPAITTVVLEWFAVMTIVITVCFIQEHSPDTRVRVRSRQDEHSGNMEKLGSDIGWNGYF